MKIADLLIKTRGNQSEVARMLGVNRQTLKKHMDNPANHIVVQDGDAYSLFVRIGG